MGVYMTNEELHLRNELSKWELRFIGKQSDQDLLIKLKFEYAINNSFVELINIVSEVMAECRKEIEAYHQAQQEQEAIAQETTVVPLELSPETKPTPKIRTPHRNVQKKGCPSRNPKFKKH